MASLNTSPSWLERPIIKEPTKTLTVYNLLVVLILVLAVLSRFLMLGERVMSHDEVNHVVPSYDLYQGRGYRHDPVTHGPFQFHVVALSYFMFGDNDFTSRIPAATFSVAAIAFVLFAFRRYFGRSGALIAGFLFLISPYLLFYGRYTRNEGFIELFGVMLLYGILRYLERGDRVGMFLVTFATVMHFITKETAFIYTAEALIFLFVVFILEVRRAEFRDPARFNRFLVLMGGAMFLFMVALGLFMSGRASKAAAEATATVTASATPGLGGNMFDVSHLRLYGEGISVVAALIFGLLGLLSIAKDLGWERIKRLRSFTLIIIVGTLILPMLSPFPVTLLGWNPLDYANMASVLRTGGFILLFFAIGVLIGIWWNPVVWLQNAFLFYSIFTVFYTTFFTNGDGFLTGIVGSLGYWLAQQGVERGSQPLYFYALIQMPVYEFIGYLGTILAVYFGIRYKRFATLPGYAPALAPRVVESETVEAEQGEPIPTTGSADIFEPENDGSRENLTAPKELVASEADAATAAFYAIPRPLPVLALLLYWSIISLFAFSFAGERMPWLTVHITMGFLLAAGWGLGYLVDTTNWKALTRWNGLLAVLLIPVLYASSASAIGTLLGTNPPFSGSQITQLQATSRFMISIIAAGASLAGILYLLRGWAGNQVLRLATAVFFILMAVLTARAAYRASFINYNYATEYLVYAHASPWPKVVLKEIQEISERTTGGKNIQVAYSSDMLYPYWWYLRDYPNKRWFQTTPTRDLRDFAVVVAGEDVFDKITPVLGDNFYEFDYVRLWWPNQDYFNLTWDRVWAVISNPQMREAVFNIWLNRDYSEYAKVTNQGPQLSLEDWSPAARMRVYIRKDIAAKIWQFGASPAAPVESTDPFAKNLVKLQPVQVVGATGSQPGQFQAPRGMTVAPDGSLFVADSRNNRIQHIGADGKVIKVWGSFADVASGNAPGGTFYEPWDVAVGKDGSVYVSDTWNHRVQKFTADGQFVKMWGYFGQGEAPEAFWGPRGLAIDSQGRVYVMDTGNKRVVIFDADGNFIAQFGSAGFDQGQFDEPVGIAIDAKGEAYITDTWNQRVQVMAPTGEDVKQWKFVRSWDITGGWAGQSLDNKPFLAVSPVNGDVFVTDPEKPRLLEFDAQGKFIRGWGDYSTGTDGFGIASGVAVAPDGSVWVSDGANNVLLRFQMPK